MTDQPVARTSKNGVEAAYELLKWLDRRGGLGLEVHEQVNRVMMQIERERATPETRTQPPLVLNGYQLKQALDFLDNEEETNLCVAWYGQDRREHDKPDGELMPAGVYCWLSEYPEEGQLLLKEER